MEKFHHKLMHRFNIFIFLLFIFPWLNGIILAQERMELNTVLMESTFKIQGEGSVGTAFIIGRVSKKDTEKAYYVLVTAAHVLNEIKSDTAQIILRKKKEDGAYERLPFWIKIRQNNKPLWVRHNDADVAAIYIGLPEEVDIPLLSTEWLGGDEEFDKFEIHPGDELKCLGYPLGAEANEIGFPILRSGKIASYPLIPSKRVKTFLYDVEIFKGNSGGPVYFTESSRTFKDALVPGTIQFIVGLISKERLLIKATRDPYKSTIEEHRLGLAEVVHAIFIKETIEKLQELE